MRNRLIRSTLLIALLAVITLGMPLVILARHEVFSRAHDRLQEEAARVAAGLEDRLDAGEPITPARITALLPKRHVEVLTREGIHVSGGPNASGHLDSSSVEVSGAKVTVFAAHAMTADRAREVTVFVIALGAIATLASVGLAVRQAGRLAAPLDQLAARADSLGQGDFTASPIVSGVPEIDAISRELERTAAQIGRLVVMQRDFASDAAHQLRTPLTGIGLRLEEIALLGDEAIKSEADDALEQVERLNKVIGSLLARARGDSAAPTDVELADLVREEASVWGRVLATRERELVLNLGEGVRVRARREHLASVLTSLLDNALEHGSGRVTITVSQTAGSAELSVQDEGRGVPAELEVRIFERSFSGSNGTGIGLALAHSLAEAEGGQLFIAPDARSKLTLELSTL